MAMDLAPALNQTILNAIRQLKLELLAHLDASMDNIQIRLNSIHGKLSILGDQVEELEPRVSSNQDNLLDLEKRVKSMEVENVYLREKVKESENRSRAYNLRVLHVPEQAEGCDILGFMGELIPSLLGKENFPQPLILDKAHRTPTFRRQETRTGPRPILVKLLNFQDKVKILHLAREKKELRFNGVRVHIFPDFSAALLQKRWEFDQVKKKLRDRNLKYSLLYPARLKILSDGKSIIFNCPNDANAFLRDI